MILDMDNPLTWNEQFNDLFSGLDGINGTLLDQLVAIREWLSNSEAIAIRERGKEILHANYNYIIAYHACRYRNDGTYETDGILPARPDEIIEAARTLFHGINGLDEVLRDEEAICFKRTAGTVGLLFSGRRAISDKIVYFEGGERMRTITAKLGSLAQERFKAMAGSAMLIKCKIPVTWLAEYVVEYDPYEYLYELLAIVAKRLRYPALEMPQPKGGFLLSRSIPPKYIIELKDVSTIVG